MNWETVKKSYPNQWVVIEGLESHITPDNKKHFDRIAVLEIYSDGSSAMKAYRKFNKQYPQRDFYFIHTSHDHLDIAVRNWQGIRR